MRVSVAATLLAGALLCSSASAAPRVAAAAVDATRARLSYEAMQRYLFDSRTGAYRARLGAGPGVHAWPFSQALAATIAVARLPGTAAAGRRRARERFDRLARRFAKGSLYAAWPGGDVYLDDNEWIAGDLLDWDELTGAPAARRKAEAVFAAVVRAWDSNPADPCPGGVYWTATDRNLDRNTVTTANGAILGLRLYALTRRPAYLGWARRMLAWLDTCMLAPNGLYWDHIRADGSVDRAQWSYNQGSVVGAYLLLYETTHDATALTRAETVAAAAVAYFSPSVLVAEPPEFVAIYFRYLLRLAAVDRSAADLAAARAYAAQEWATARNPKTGLFASQGPPRLLDQAALVQLYAELARLRLTAGP